MTDITPPEEPQFIARVDGEEFVDAISKLADSLGQLLVTMTAMELRLSALEAKGKPRKGFNQL
jgi:hypothetical protein